MITDIRGHFRYPILRFLLVVTALMLIIKGRKLSFIGAMVVLLCGMHFTLGYFIGKKSASCFQVNENSLFVDRITKEEKLKNPSIHPCV